MTGSSLRTHTLAELIAINDGQHAVGDNQVGRGNTDFMQTVFTIGGKEHLVMILQLVGNVAGHLYRLFDDEYAWLVVGIGFDDRGHVGIGRK